MTREAAERLAHELSQRAPPGVYYEVAQRQPRVSTAMPPISTFYVRRVDTTRRRSR